MDFLASMRPPMIIGGNPITGNRNDCAAAASMRPPMIIGGNIATWKDLVPLNWSFNEAADDHRRKYGRCGGSGWHRNASMRPPMIIGGNVATDVEAMSLYTLQ